MDGDSYILNQILQEFTGSRIQLTAHQLRRQFQNRHLQARLFQFPGCFQSQNTTADYHGVLRLRKKGAYFLRIGDSPDRYNMRLIMTWNRWNKAFRTQGVNQLVIF